MKTTADTALYMLADEDLLAHLQYLPVAFAGRAACAWDGVRSFLLDVEVIGVAACCPSQLPQPTTRAHDAPGARCLRQAST